AALGKAALPHPVPPRASVAVRARAALRRDRARDARAADRVLVRAVPRGQRPVEHAGVPDRARHRPDGAARDPARLAAAALVDARPDLGRPRDPSCSARRRPRLRDRDVLRAWARVRGDRRRADRGRGAQGAPGRDPLTDMRTWFRIFFIGGVIAYRGLFNWIAPAYYIPTMLLGPIFQILFFAYLGRYSHAGSDTFFVV